MWGGGREGGHSLERGQLLKEVQFSMQEVFCVYISYRYSRTSVAQTGWDHENCFKHGVKGSSSHPVLVSL